jgi:histidinol-phosphate aminotransferase
VPERRRINATIRQETFQWLERNGYSYIPSESNCFLLDVKRPGKTVIDAMAEQNVFVGRIWPVMPNHVRITVGTQDEMQHFQVALQKVMRGVTAFSLPGVRPGRDPRRQAFLPS